MSLHEDLRVELDSAPSLYGPMSDQQVADYLAELEGELPVNAISSSDVFEAIHPPEYAPLSNAQKAILSDIFSLGEVQLGGNAQTALTNIFPAGSTTRTNLIALTKTTVTRAEEKGLGVVHAGDVAAARAL